MKRWEIWLTDGLQAVKAKDIEATEASANEEAKELSERCTWPNVQLIYQCKNFGEWHMGVLVRRGFGRVE